MVSRWTVNSVIFDNVGPVRTFENVRGDLDVRVRIVAVSLVTVNYRAEQNGAIVSATTDGMAFESGYGFVGGGTEVIFTAAPDEGYVVEKWVVNGIEVRDANGNIFFGSVYVMPSIAMDVYLVVYFTEISTDASVYDIFLSGFAPGAQVGFTFDPTVASYTVNVPNAVSSITVNVKATCDRAMIEVNNALSRGTAARAVTLNVGSNPIDVIVTAEDGADKSEYVITVNRAEPTPINNNNNNNNNGRI
jgi:hypothetical protein